MASPLRSSAPLHLDSLRCRRQRSSELGRSALSLGLGLSLGVCLSVGLAVCALPNQANAAEPTPSSDYAPTETRTRFGAPLPLWPVGPAFQLQLQPERARVALFLPPEWMPAPVANTRGLYFPTTRAFRFHGPDSLEARATVGSRMHLFLSDPSHNLDFSLNLSGRSAVAVLHFDPIAWTR